MIYLFLNSNTRTFFAYDGTICRIDFIDREYRGKIFFAERNLGRTRSSIREQVSAKSVSENKRSDFRAKIRCFLIFAKIDVAPRNGRIQGQT